MDKIIEKLAALGIPGLILLILVGISGFAGAAAVTSSLALLGGPFGMLGGIAMLGVISLVAASISKYGFETLLLAMVMRLSDNGHTKQDVIDAVNKMLISKELKRKIIDTVEKAFKDSNAGG